jgi:sulfate adenylyltransferase (ADP) / ATP adenylyltransferase
MAAGSSDAGPGAGHGAHDSALWRQVVACTRHAGACGALAPIATVYQTVAHAGIAFAVRLAEGIERKTTATVTRRQHQIDPFLPYDEDLFVASLSETHVCLLNKFNVLDHHLLVVTREYEDQDEPLNVRDFEALWACLVEIDGLGFYNGGEVGGASQRHKHFQMVPGALGPGPDLVPIEPAIRAARFAGDLGVTDALPFAHVIARLHGPLAAGARAAASLTAYEAMRRALRLEQGDPYNLLVMREWMLLVPRARERWGRVSVNALGFAGALLVRTGAELAELERIGPMTVLQSVAMPPVGLAPGP